MQALADLCADLPHGHIVDAGCGEGSYDAYLYKALGDEPAIVGFDLSKETVRLAAKLLPEAAFCVGGSFCAPVRDGWADLLLNIFSPFAGAEFRRMLRPGGHLVYAVPTARHLYGLKEVLYDPPLRERGEGHRLRGVHLCAQCGGRRPADPDRRCRAAVVCHEPPTTGTAPADGAAHLQACKSLTTEIGFRYLVYQKQ